MREAAGVQQDACRTCHVVREGDNRLGPNLSKIVGRKAGSLPDYGFSGAMKNAGVRDEEELSLHRQRTARAGQQHEAVWRSRLERERKKIIAYLAQQIDNATSRYPGQMRSPADCA